jgi:phosphopantothenoylcysteine decarboxylase/phosphopantothenate--cysteine ligase
MNCRMYENPVVQRNIAALKSLGHGFVGPERGEMACGEYGWGRMSEPVAIADEVVRLLAAGTALAGRRFLVSAGPTYEDIDPVRFIGNRSSGRMGFEVAAEARLRGAEVTLVHGPSALVPPAGVKAVAVRSASEMREAVMKHAKTADVVVMAAAVADYRPETASREKIKKTEEALTIRLVRNPDILAELGRKRRKGTLLVGFAAETGELEKNALKKLRDKGLDLVAANPVGGDTGFESADNTLRIYGKEGLIRDTGRVSKREAAGRLLDIIIEKAGFKG